MRRVPMAAAVATTFHRRHLLDPKDGWFRRTERETNKFLSRHIYPKIPGLPRLYSRTLERHLTVTEADLPLPGLGRQATRLLLLSDLHAGPFVQSATLAKTFRRLRVLQPDIIAVVGDFATTHLREVEMSLSALRELRAPHGCFAVLGNHDHYTEDPARLRHLLGGVGIEVLHNQCVPIRLGSSQIQLAGIDDLLGGEPDLDAALDGHSPETPTILLSHNPDLFPEAAHRGVPLMLSGHTHGGQMRIRGFEVVVRMSRYRLDYGLYRAGDSHLVVTRGLGVTGLPFRVGCAPEAVLLRLRAPEDPISGHESSGTRKGRCARPDAAAEVVDSSDDYQR